MNVLKLMTAPFVECLILVGIHSYLGLHVIRRRIIFVDLALAQVAALGATIGFIFAIQPGTLGSFVFSLTFCLLGAALFSLTRMRSDRIPQEAVIGLCYAIIAALSVLVIHKTKGADHLEDLLCGNLLWVSWTDVFTAGSAYAVIGLFHYIFRRQFLLISDDPEAAYQQGMSVRFWDFLFYASFGFVITFSVRVAGVLLVFVFLVAPAILAVMITQSFRAQLLVGWIAGTVVSVIGLYLSYRLDLPSGPAVVSFYGVVLVATAVVLAVVRSKAPRRALALAGVGGLVVLGLGFGLVQEGRLLAAIGEPMAAAAHERPAAAPAPAAKDPETLLEGARTAIARKDASARRLLLGLLESVELPPFFRSEALDLLRKLAGQDFGYAPEKDPAGNRSALDAIRAWAAGKPSS